MNKVAITYWDNSHTISMSAGSREKKTRTESKAAPQWLVFTVIGAITLMLCLAVNFRAYAEMTQEVEQNERLALAVEQLSNENLGLQTEVHGLKNDARTVELEARKIGMSRPNEKVLVPVK